MKEAEAAAAAVAAQVASVPLGEAKSTPVQQQGDGAGNTPPTRQGSLEDIQRPSTSMTAQQQPIPPSSPYHYPQKQKQAINSPISSGSTTATAYDTLNIRNKVKVSNFLLNDWLIKTVKLF